jgi:hypothetical protein
MTLLPGQEPLRKPHPARHVLGPAGLVVWVVLIMGGFFAAAHYVSTILTGGNMAAVISAALVDLANKDRAEESLSTLTVSELLTQAAQAKANDMAERGYFSHTSPDGSQPWKWIQDAGYEYASAGENLAVNFSDSEKVENAWMDSPGHRANILNAKFTEIGIATAVGEYKGRRTTFVVQMFGTPRTKVAVHEEQTVATPENPEDIAVAVRDGSGQILGSEAEAGASAQTPEEIIAPAPVSEVVDAPVLAQTNAIERFLASPGSLLRTLYILCGLIVLVALLLTTRLEFKRHHIRHVVAASLLIVLMGGTLLLADQVIFEEPILAEAAEN